MGCRFPGDENLDRLCEIFQVTLAELFIEPGQSINIDNKSGKIDKTDKTETAVVGNDLSLFGRSRNRSQTIPQLLKIPKQKRPSFRKNGRAVLLCLYFELEGRLF